MSAQFTEQSERKLKARISSPRRRGSKIPDQVRDDRRKLPEFGEADLRELGWLSIFKTKTPAFAGVTTGYKKVKELS